VLHRHSRATELLSERNAFSDEVRRQAAINATLMERLTYAEQVRGQKRGGSICSLPEFFCACQYELGGLEPQRLGGQGRAAPSPGDEANMDRQQHKGWQVGIKQGEKGRSAGGVERVL